MSNVTVTIQRPYPKQQEILNNRKRNNLLLLPRRWGKTTISSILALKESIVHKNHRVAWSAPTWKLMIETFEQHRNVLMPIISRVNREDRRIELKNGSVIEYWSSDDPSAGRGRKYHTWISDETQRQRKLNEFIKASVRPCLADFRGELWVLGTPNGVGSSFHAFYEECVKDGGWNIAKGILDDNPYIHPDEIAQMRKDMGYTLSRQEIDAEWVKIDGVAPLIGSVEWEALFDIPAGRRMQKLLVIDGSLSGDTTALIAVWRDLVTHQYFVDYEDIWCFNPETTTELMDGQIDYTVIESLLFALWQSGRFSALVYDPYQMVSLAQRLKRRGVRTIEFTQNIQRLKADSFLKQVLSDGLLHHPNHPDLNEHILNATIKYNPNNSIRIVKSEQKKRIDLAVALSMGVYSLSTLTPSKIDEYTPTIADISHRPIEIINQGTINIVGSLNPFQK